MSEKEPSKTEEFQETSQIVPEVGQDDLIRQQSEANKAIAQEDNNPQEIAALKKEIEQVYDSGKIWNTLSRHNLEWVKSISPEDLKMIKEYHRWSLPVNHSLRGIELPERVTPEDRANISPIIETLDRVMKDCPPTPVEFKVYRAISENVTLEDAQKMVGQTINPDKGYMSTTTSRNLAINDFLQKREDKILYEITVPEGEKGIWMASVLNFRESASRESEFLLPRDSQFLVTGVEERWFINRRSRNAEDSASYGKERRTPPQFKEKRLVIKLGLRNRFGKENIEKSGKIERKETDIDITEKKPAKSWLKRIFGK